tara:strand:+ start:89 stop:868 length:780 start_codon:yes stop_codon:yes gene_type:complete
MRISILFIVFGTYLLSQNVDMYLSLIHEGQSQGVKENLPELISKYPNDAGVLYLQALLTANGMKSLELYSNLIEKFPESKYSGEASAKIGEYFYARGLYSQAGRQLCLIPRKYPRLSNMQEIIDMMVSSFKAIGENDSVRYYTGIYQSMFPNLEFNKYGIESIEVPNTKILDQKKTNQLRPYIVQIGAFGSIQNAKRLKLQVSQIGYDVAISKVRTNGKSLNAVRVVRFRSKSAAERVGQSIKKKLGIDFRVLYRPENN